MAVDYTENKTGDLKKKKEKKNKKSLYKLNKPS